MATRADITPELLSQLLSYDPDTGALTWKPRTPEMFAHCRYPNRACARWNACFAGKAALNSTNHTGHKVGTIWLLPVFAHRAAWALHYGTMPKADIDHIDGDPANNRIANLRDVSREINLRNMRRKSDAKPIGVNQTPSGTWRARISAGPKRLVVHLGSWPTQAEANAAWRGAAKILGYTLEHGNKRD
jgi:hypothetical protein